jgi:hypothetical protein
MGRFEPVPSCPCASSGADRSPDAGSRATVYGIARINKPIVPGRRSSFGGHDLGRLIQWPDAKC